MFHVTNFGSYAGYVQPFADLDGYVPEEGDDAADFRGRDFDDDDEWAEFVAEAVKATARAGGEVDVWRRG